jgi:hypothetical protein
MHVIQCMVMITEGEGDTPPLLSHKKLLSNASPVLKTMCDNAVSNRVSLSIQSHTAHRITLSTHRVLTIHVW